MNKNIHPCGVLFFNKPKGWTSRKAVNHVIRLFSRPEQKNRKQRPKAGHTGTLDPLATGMLPILIGDATRFSDMGLSANKGYEVTFDLSLQTDTLDLEGKITETFENVALNQDKLLEVLKQFEGEIEQIPPSFSAIRVEGKRAHSLARQGQDVQLQARKVTIQAIRLLEMNGSLVSLAVECSKGTYIRSLARDIGVALGYGGCVTMLHRSSTGGWSKEMMVNLEELEEKKEACILPIQTWLRDLSMVLLDKVEAKRFVQGQRLSMPFDVPDQALCCVSFGEQVLGTATYDGVKQVLQPVRVLPSAQEKMK